jgi:hypothetical protein
VCMHNGLLGAYAIYESCRGVGSRTRFIDLRPSRADISMHDAGLRMTLVRPSRPNCDNSIIIGNGFFNILDELSHRVNFTFHNAWRRRRKDSPFSGGIAARSGHRRQRVECIICAHAMDRSELTSRTKFRTGAPGPGSTLDIPIRPSRLSRHPAERDSAQVV